jgi:hypothetical protein
VRRETRRPFAVRRLRSPFAVYVRRLRASFSAAVAVAVHEQVQRPVLRIPATVSSVNGNGNVDGERWERKRRTANGRRGSGFTAVTKPSPNFRFSAAR